MESNLRCFLPAKIITGKKVIIDRLIILIITLLLGWLILVANHYNLASLIISGLIFIPLLIWLSLIKVIIKITVDLIAKTFTAEYFNTIGQHKAVTLNLLNAIINYGFVTSKSGGYWELRIYENIINKWFKILSSKKGYTKQQLDEIYNLLLPYQQCFTSPNTRKQYILTAIFTTLILMGFYLCVVYAFQQSKTLFYIGGVFLITGIMSLVFLWFYVMPVKKGNYVLSWFLTIVLIITSAFIVDQLKSAYVKDQLKKHGITGYVQILSNYKSQNTDRVMGRNLVTFGYTINHKTYFKTIENENGIYNTGDSLKIICSSVNPEIYIIAGHKKAGHKLAKITSHD